MHLARKFHYETRFKSHHLETRFESHQEGRKSSGHRSGSLADSKKKDSYGGSDLSVLLPIISLPLSSSVVHVHIPPHFLDQWKSITSNRVVLNMVKGHHHHLRYCFLYSITSNGLTL